MSLAQYNASFVEIVGYQPAQSKIALFSECDAGSAIALESVEVMQQDTSLADSSVLVFCLNALSDEFLNGLSAFIEDNAVPVVVFVDQHKPELLERAIDTGVTTYIEDGFSLHRLPTIIDMALVRFKQTQALFNELVATKTKLDERKLIERAKGILMSKNKLSEDEAYRQMRSSAMNKSISMAALSKQLISVFEIIE